MLNQRKTKTLRIKERLLMLDTPIVMGILNVTPDSFYVNSRQSNVVAIAKRIETIIDEGGAIIDVGGYSSRPDAVDVSADEEWRRLKPALQILRDTYPSIAVSVDTFRADIAARAVEEYGVSIINDISGGVIDKQMFKTAARLNVPYILMHMRGVPQTMQQHTDYDCLAADIMRYFADKMQELRLLGVNDVIIDPGFGFSKTLEQNYELMRHLREFAAIFDAPLLVGISRKSMIYNLLGCTANESLNGTVALNTYSLLNGADILRVHDVRAAIETIKITANLKL